MPRRLGWEKSVATCQVCASTFSIEAGIPVLLATSLEDQPYKLRQADSHNGARSEFFERTRPRGAPRFYGLLLQEKLSRSISALRGELDGARAVVICAGSGMDAEFLARQGLPTLALDISLGACKRAHRRAEETGLPILPVVADAENVPLRDASVELAYVHDGLAAFRVANGLLGRVGNKMSVQAVRKPPSGVAAPNEKSSSRPGAG